jgi:sialidase-1
LLGAGICRHFGILLLSLAALAAPPFLTRSELFEAGQGGYKLYRIPGIIVTGRGTILVYCEARKFTGSDWDTIDIQLRRSTDRGQTFSPARIVGHVTVPVTRSSLAIEKNQGRPTDVTYNNPVAIPDRGGLIHFLFCIDYQRVFHMRSKDDGVTFSQPKEITAALDGFRPEYAWRAAATGPGHGIQLSSGRLLVPVWLGLGTQGNGHGPSVSSTIYSDDHGATWQRGAIAVRDTPDFPSPNETEAVQLADGRVMPNVRTAGRNRRTIVTSQNGATGWSPPRLQEELPDPICFAGLVRLSTAKKSGGRNRLLFSNPDNLTRQDGRDVPSRDRRNLTIRLSYDEGASWPVKKALEPGIAGYSDLSVLPDGTILCFYESGSASPPNGALTQRLVLARFNLEWLTDGADSLTKGNQH